MPIAPVSHAVTYADESDDKKCFVLSCVSIPTAQVQPAQSEWDAPSLSNEWKEYFLAAKAWRASLRDEFRIPVSKELKGSKLATGRNSYDFGRKALYGERAIEAYRFALKSLEFLPGSSVFSVAANAGYTIYGHRKLQASLYAMFQRLERMMTHKCKTIIFFDEGHAEYRALFRRACVFMPTGSSRGSWADGSYSKNKPLSCAIEDANFKDSKTSWFVQIADLVAYATLTKLRKERGDLSEKEIRLGSGDLHDYIPRDVLNRRVVTNGTDGIVRLR